jgi:mRNA interferase MazF
MRFGKVYKTGEVILAQIQFTDTFEIKTRPAVVLFEEYGNIVVAGITSNTKMEGIPLTKKDGAVKDSIIKINYIFTISGKMVKKKLFSLSNEKKKVLISEVMRRMG